ncbi:MAG: DUF3857 and transglutaminase domain-containing protein [Rikenellaceae bacterium]
MKLFTLATSMLMFSSVAFAQSWRGLDAQASCNEEFAKHPTINLLDSIGVEVNANGSGVFTIRQVMKVQNQSAELKNRVIKYGYDPLTAYAEFRSVTIYKADGSVVEVDVESTCDYAAPARAIYWGAREIMVEVGRLEVGDVVDYTIDKQGFTYALLSEFDAGSDSDRFIPPMRGQYYDIVPFWVTEPTVKKIYSVSLPKDKPVQYEFYQGECAVAVRNGEQSNLYQFTKSNILPLKMEKNMVDRFDVAPKLMMSTTPTWFDKSEWFYNVNEDYGSFEAYEPAQKLVDKLIKDCDDNMSKIAVLTHWVADNMRYSGISMGKGEGFTLHNTQMNFTDRAGVCKDKAALLISMLRMAGLEAYPAMTMAGSRIESIPADHFNHCVAVVRTDEGVLMPLDPTWVPFSREVWSSAEQQQNYLPGTPEPSDLCLTPVSAPENHLFDLKAKSTLSSNGTLVGTITVSAEGVSDSSIRSPFTTGLRSQWRTAMEQELMKISPEAKLVSVDYGKNPKDYQRAAISITYRFEIPNYALVGDGVMAFKPITMSNFYSNVRSFLRVDTTAEERQFGFKDSCSRLVEFDEEIIVPQGYSLIGGDKNEESISDAAEFSGSIAASDNVISISQRLSLNKRVYEAEDWDGYRSAVTKHKSFGSDMIIKKL